MKIYYPVQTRREAVRRYQQGDDLEDIKRDLRLHTKSVIIGWAKRAGVELRKVKRQEDKAARLIKEQRARIRTAIK